VTACPPRQRIDKWLWFARIAKSRSIAQKLVADGQVRINKIRVDKPSRDVLLGDIVTVAIHNRVYVLKVLDAGVRRGPALEAQRLYRSVDPAVPSDLSQLD
jgi:ribosome-associated heat shock protein Hsp15